MLPINLQHRLSVLAVAVGLGAALGGLQAHTALYDFSVVPGRWLLVAAVLAGPVLYWWCDDIGELLAGISLTLVATMVSAVAARSVPVYVQDLTIPEQNLVLLNAISESLIYTGLTGVLFAFGLVLGALVVKELEPGDLLGGHGRTVAIALTVVMIAGGVLLGAVVASNYAAAIDQRDAPAEVNWVEESDGEVRIGIVVDNRLPARMHVDSAVLTFAGDNQRASQSAFPRGYVEPESQGEFVVTVGCEKLSEEGVADADELSITGNVYVVAFNDYNQRIPISERTVPQPC